MSESNSPQAKKLRQKFEDIIREEFKISDDEEISSATVSWDENTMIDCDLKRTTAFYESKSGRVKEDDQEESNDKPATVDTSSKVRVTDIKGLNDFQISEIRKKIRFWGREEKLNAQQLKAMDIIGKKRNGKLSDGERIQLVNIYNDLTG